MKLSEFVELVGKMSERKYEIGENDWHAKALCFCRKKVLEQRFVDIAMKELVVLGILVHRGVSSVIGYEEKVFSKKVGKYTIYGTPDIVNGEDVIEVKFTSRLPSEPREFDVMQLKIYLWLLDKEKGYLWYFSPYGFAEYEVSGKFTDEDILNLIENPKTPLWSWECRYCNLCSV